MLSGGDEKPAHIHARPLSRVKLQERILELPTDIETHIGGDEAGGGAVVDVIVPGFPCPVEEKWREWAASHC